MIVPVHKLQPGMTLARDVTNLNGGVLLIKGTELTPQHLSALVRCGLNSVHIVTDEAEMGTQIRLTPEIQQAAEAKVRRRFQHIAPNTPGLSLLKELAIKRSATQLAQLANAQSVPPA